MALRNSFPPFYTYYVPYSSLAYAISSLYVPCHVPFLFSLSPHKRYANHLVLAVCTFAVPYTFVSRTAHLTQSEGQNPLYIKKMDHF
jgi:hypothetical protein